MKRLDPVTFRERVADYEAAIVACPEIAKFCSGPDWQLAAHSGLHGQSDDGEIFVFEEEGTWLVFRENAPSVFFPLESAWCFGCPIIGDPESAVALLRRAVSKLSPGGAGFLISGVRIDGHLHAELKKQEAGALRYSEFPTTDCMIIHLSDGIDEWLARRSKKFRRTIRNLSLPEEIVIESAGDGDPETQFSRMLAVQQKTYKWRDGSDIFQSDEYRDFYRDLLGRLSEKGGVRIQFAKKDGEDVAYIFGGVSGNVYRGFQMSYAEEMRSFGLGNILQIDNLRRMEAEGVCHYDLGMHSEYKERWADEREEYIGVFLVLSA